MTDRDVNERLLRLHAALDGELDAMGSLEFEREMRDDPAIAAEYRRLAALRDAVRRHAPREAAPQALADLIAALTASPPAAPPSQAPASPSATVVPFRRRAWLDSRALAMAASLVSSASRSARGLRRYAPRPARVMSPNIRSRICARRNCRSAVRRRLLRPAYGQAVACQPHNRQRNHRRSRATLPVGGRARRRHRSDPDTDARLPTQRACRRGDRAASRRQAGPGDRRDRDNRRLPRRALVRLEPRPMSPFPIWTRPRSANSSRRSGVVAAQRPSPPSRDALVARLAIGCIRFAHPRPRPKPAAQPPCRRAHHSSS